MGPDPIPINLGQKICRGTHFKLGEIEVQEFPDGERYQRISPDASNRSVALIGGTTSDSDTLEIYDTACALAKYGARRLNLGTPYLVTEQWNEL